MNKLYIGIIAFFMFCKTPQEQMQETNENPEIETKREIIENTISNTTSNTASKKKKQIIEPLKDNKNVPISPLVEDAKNNDVRNFTKKATEENQKSENNIPTEAYKWIAFYKTQNKEKEDQYWYDYKNFQAEKNRIISYKTNQKNSEISYESYKKEYWVHLENKKRIKEEELNQKDPERKMFWRIDFNQEFPEQIHFKIQADVQVYLCEIQNPILYILKHEFRCNSKPIKIDSKVLKNSNFFETISLFNFLPERNSYFIIFIEQNQKQAPLVIYNKNQEPYKIAFIETDGKILLKLYLYTEKIIKDKKKYYFKMISPLDFLFGPSE